MTSKVKYKYLVNIQGNCLICAGVLNGYSYIDSDTTHFSFMMYDVDPEEFIECIEDLMYIHKHNNHHSSVLIESQNPSDNIRVTNQGRTVSITRGNCKVLYHGDIEPLIGLVGAIRKNLDGRCSQVRPYR